MPIEPTNLTGNSVSTTQINLHWTDNSTNEKGFKIERRIEAGNYAVIGNVNADILTFSDVGLTPNTTYIYRVYSYNDAGNSLTYSNEVIVSPTVPPTIPIVTTTLPSEITTNSALSGGSIATDGGSAITSKGVVWSTSINPTIALSTKTNDGEGNDVFASVITGLLPGTTYYLKAYGINISGVGYGNEISFTTLAPATPVTDIDSNVYETVAINTQIWTKTNLNVSRYRNGDIIPEVTDPTTWQTLTTGAWCYYQNDTANGSEYGKLYNWYAVNDPRGLAPTGYHIRSDSEWTTLTNYLGGIPVAGGTLKESGSAHWNSPNVDATNSSNFTALPGGRRENGLFDTIGNYGFWWSSTDYNNSITAYEFNLYYYLGSTNRNNFDKHNGFSVRCVRD